MGVQLQDNICPILCKKMCEDAKVDSFFHQVIHTEFAFPAFWQLFYRSILNKGNNKITELRTILQRESPNS